MASNRFAFQLGLRVGFLALVLFALGIALGAPGYHATSLLLFLIAAGLVVDLYRRVNRTGIEVSRFLDAARSQDYSQDFMEQATEVGGIEDLGANMNAIMNDMQAARKQDAEKRRHLETLVDHIPLPLLALRPDGEVRLYNNAARRLFSPNAVQSQEDLKSFGDDFAAALGALEPGLRRLIVFHHDGVERRMIAMMTRIVIGNRGEDLISLQDVQSELDDAQLFAFRDLSRVLTHEILNSITPIASLSRTAADLVGELPAPGDSSDANANNDKNNGPNAGAGAETLADARQAVDTVARRSRDLLQFVRDYRSIVNSPPPRKERFQIDELFARLGQLFAADWPNLTLEVRLEPRGLELDADPGLIEQVLINLLRNAAEALSESRSDASGRIRLIGRLNQRGHVLIEVEDDGPGVAAGIVERIFTPFFTTRSKGSGVGLALGRQIMIAHGGALSLTANGPTGARFSLAF